MNKSDNWREVIIATTPRRFNGHHRAMSDHTAADQVHTKHSKITHRIVANNLLLCSGFRQRECVWWTRVCPVLYANGVQFDSWHRPQNLGRHQHSFGPQQWLAQLWKCPVARGENIFTANYHFIHAAFLSGTNYTGRCVSQHSLHDQQLAMTILSSSTEVPLTKPKTRPLTHAVLECHLNDGYPSSI